MVRKLLFFIGFVSLVHVTCLAQVVTTEPAFPTLSQSVTIYFHAQGGNGGLAGFSGDVYAHTGVITNLSNSGANWRYVKTNWGQNTPETKLTRIATDEYKLEIADIRTYYNVPNTEDILQLAFVFRSADTSKEGKDTGNADIFVDVYENTFNVRFTTPQADAFSPIIKASGSTLAVEAEASSTLSSIVSMKLFLNQNLVTENSNQTTLSHTLTLGNETENLVTIEAMDSLGAIASDSFYVYVRPTTVEMPVPDGLVDGINYHADPSKATLVLRAPYKEFIYVIGDFNDWKLDASYLMHKETLSSDDVRWWITLEGLESKKEYAFQYFVDGEIRVADPYSEKVLDGANDKYISSTTYPNLLPYPEGKTEHLVSVLQTNQTPYTWQATSFQRPEQEKLVIYETLIRDFIGKHDYKTLTDTLAYFKRLGITAIELMPVMEFDGNESWGYNTAFMMALDKYYGPKKDFQAFIDSCHQRGIAVILDIVFNHQTGQSPLVRLYNEGNYGKPTAENPWMNRDAPHEVIDFFEDVNHESALTQYWVDRVLTYWLTEYKVDGFRFDFTKGMTQRHTTSWAGLDAFDASRVAILERIADTVWAIEPTAYVILEHFVVAEETALTEYKTASGFPGMMVWNNMNHTYNEASMGYSANLTGTHFSSRNWTHPNLLTYMESHDEQWLMYKNRTYGNASGDYNIRDLGIALERQKLVGAFFFLVPGPRMIWQFGELGYGGGTGECLFGNENCPAGTPSRTGNKPIRWNYQTDPLRAKLYQTWATLIGLRNDNPIFSSKETQIVMSLSGTVKSFRLTNGNMNATIIGNFGVTETTATANFVHPGTWYNYFENSAVNLSQNSLEVTLLPGQFFIYTDKQLPAPPANLLTVSSESLENLPQTLTLSQNYPNPFNPATTIAYAVPQTGWVTLEVFNTLGQSVGTLVNQVQTAGEYAVTFSGLELPSGIYFYRLEQANHFQTKKMMLLK